MKEAGSTPNHSEVTSSCTEICKNDNRGLSASKIVLVDVSLPERPNDIHRVYALLDKQRNTSLISPKLVDKLGVKGKSEKYLLPTCSGSKEVRYGRRVSGLIAKSLSGKSLTLPTCVECDSIPEDKREIPTTEMAQQFPHLQPIASKIPPSDPDAEICPLIGRDAPESLKVRSFINGPKDAPWAQKLFLGWTICEQVCLERLGGAVHISVNRTTIQKPNESAPSDGLCYPTRFAKPQGSNLGNYTNFTFTPCPNNLMVKEILGEKRVIDDIYHTSPNDNEVTSIEDRRFADIVEKGIHKN